MLGTALHFELCVFYYIFSLCSEHMHPHALPRLGKAHSWCMVPLKPTVKYTVNWLLHSLEGPPQCALHYGLTGGWVQNFKPSYLPCFVQCAMVDQALG